ncbi:hypothetical protein AJ78_07592 [Emergomyces pasteurianus Ep9510]|uniref:Uncharacterized protein n=1 Tax=Emergomyces pasteurianus Ep9510 TaxID=1447872 RepID=A0A1J9Q945_9EURO|nr:hypothetical protein AJ78_07592 [Emergomyces pasteurianus Ep9510]
MNTLEEERPMCSEFKILRDMTNQWIGQVRDDSHKNSNFEPLTSPSTGRDQLDTYHSTVYSLKRCKPEDLQSSFQKNRDKKMPFKIFMYQN